MKYHKAEWHDYKRPGICSFTLTQNPGFPGFCEIHGTPANPEITVLPMGWVVIKTIGEINQRLRGNAFISPYQLMPDHIHLLVAITNELERSIRSELAVLKSACTKAYRDMKGMEGTIPMFVSDMHDRIVFDPQHFEAAKNYILDNPRRLLIKRANKDLFRRYLHLSVGDMEFAACGNIFLLKDFEKLQVRIHRKWDWNELTSYKERCLRCAENGGVIVSPFIHEWERDIREDCIKAGARVILLQAEGMPERFKPMGRNFDLCTEGRLLVLAPWPEAKDKIGMKREIAMDLNEMARKICEDGLECRIRRDK